MYFYIVMPAKQICVSISEEDLQYIKQRGDSPSAMLRKYIREERAKNG